MILQDVMITYSKKTKIYKFYEDGKETEVKGDMAYYRICSMLAKAIEKEENSNGDLR